MALLGAYMLWHEEGESLPDYLDNKVFAGAESSTLAAGTEDVEGFSSFLARYRNALPLERLATEVLKIDKLPKAFLDGERKFQQIRDAIKQIDPPHVLSFLSEQHKKADSSGEDTGKS